MEEFSGLNSSFLYLEIPKTPMQIVGVTIIEGSLEFDDFRQYVSKQLHTVENLPKSWSQCRLVSIDLFG